MKGPIALTGSTGFVGQHLVKMLTDAGFSLRLLVREGPRTCGFGSAEVILGSLNDDAALDRLVSGASAVIHLAGAIAAPDRAQFFAINTGGTENLAKAAIAAGVGRFIHVSSLSAREPGLSDYAASKRAGEDVLGMLKPECLLIVRPPVVYGPGDRATLPLFAQLTRRIAFIPGTRQARFSLLFVEDLAKFLLDRLADDSQGLIEIDDGKPQGYDWSDLLMIAAEVEGRKARAVFLPQWLLEALAWPVSRLGALFKLGIPLTPGKVRELYHRDWVVRATYPQSQGLKQFAEGFRLTIAWYREQGWLPGKPVTDRTPPAKFYGEKSK
jgi:nucleoside-diphosphate-sugar epimerase